MPADPGDGRQFLDRAGRKRRVIATLVVTDAVMLAAATFGATWIRFGGVQATAGLENVPDSVAYYQIALVLSAIWLVMLWQEKLYDLDRLTWGAGEFSRVLRGIALGVVAFILATYALKTPGLSRAWTLIAFVLAVVLVSAGRLLVRNVLVWQRRKGKLHRRTLVVGSNREAQNIIRHLLGRPEQGLTPVGCLATERAGELELDYCAEDVPSFGSARELADVVRAHGIDTVIIASSAFDHDVISRMIGELRGIDVSIHISSGLFEVLTSRVLVREVAGIPLVTVKGVTLTPGALRTKRVFDIAVSLVVILVGLPLWLVLVLAIKIDSRGPIFYRQERMGKDRVPFGMFKFRSMCADADARRSELAEANEATGPLFKMKDDPRVTRVGKWMRKFSIDEFPQLINVLRGEMSLVGPRPPLPCETGEYSDHHWRRMEVPPGMTGLWQVSGRSSLTFEEMVRLDLFYIENWSVGFDIALMARTVPAVLFARGAY
ncbi:MAG: sugar transferase [Coriobacteriia bacterium]|nr:sugar transferase [Coriobacteriia bacterium]